MGSGARKNAHQLDHYYVAIGLWANVLVHNTFFICQQLSYAKWLIQQHIISKLCHSMV